MRRSATGLSIKRTPISFVLAEVFYQLTDERRFEISRAGHDRVSPHIEIPEEVESDDEEQYDVITSFGMYWQRDAVDWSSGCAVWGKQHPSADPVNFHDQLGIYLLYDVQGLVYVGRSTERPLGRRLYEHTKDRMATRWDRFSWFGLRPVSEEGRLGDLPDKYLPNTLVPAFEALLIEALEPRQNRKRGDDLSAVEYIQHDDPETLRRRLRGMLDQI